MRPTLFRWLLDIREKDTLEALGWRECGQHAIYVTPLLFLEVPQ